MRSRKERKARKGSRSAALKKMFFLALGVLARKIRKLSALRASAVSLLHEKRSAD
jgi:hypothetical protein